MSTFTRREAINALVGSASAVALAPLQAVGQPAPEQTSPSCPTFNFAEFLDFVDVSSALTGIDQSLLAPLIAHENGKPVANGADPTLGVKLAYFCLARLNKSVYDALLVAFRNGTCNTCNKEIRESAAAQLLNHENPEIQRLARSIILAWYLGSWYEWGTENGNETAEFTVVSADAYTEGWVWRIVQAHPMGYSNLRFGHWAYAPTQAFELKNMEPASGGMS